MHVVLICISLSLSSWARLGDAREFDGVSLEPSLESLVFEGSELHPSLRSHRIELLRDLPDGLEFPANPHVSADEAFVHATARGGSQGRLDGAGMVEALYARYTDGESEIGFYGLQAGTAVEADQREAALREIWAHNAALDRTYVYRRGPLLLVVWLWTDGPLPESWVAVRSKVAQIMGSPWDVRKPVLRQPPASDEYVINPDGESPEWSLKDDRQVLSEDPFEAF